ncbi:hypothetical protein WJX73_009930 [Symbiochloris irregularis]|uniref:EF-hand domain-containing protein n=1 Tax=Symbiochloris irregularis TaxID=706552 RepID=A0AAW1PTZ2_9CHLO
MGNGTSRDGFHVNFTKKEEERLQRRFQKASGGAEKATIPYLLQYNEIKSPFAARAMQMFDQDGDGSLTLEQFKQAVDLLGNLTSQDQRAEYLFKYIDLDGSGTISLEELAHVLPGQDHPVGSQQLHEVVANLIAAFDLDGDGELSGSEFRAMLDASMSAPE